MRYEGKLLGQDFVLETSPGAKLELDYYCQYYPDSTRIVVRTGLHPDLLKHTILHEVVHCLESTMYLKLSERDVDNIALGVLSLIRDNPELIELIQREN